MKTKSGTSFSQQFLTSPVSLIVIFAVAVVSFFGGTFYQTKKTQTEINQQSEIANKLIVTRIVDGDTLQLQSGKEIRLYGMSTPEQKENFYSEANQFTESMVLNKEIILEQEDKYKQDKFGRLLGYVFVEGVNLNLELVRSGLAKVVLYEKRAKIKYQDELLQAENEARKNKVGMWSK